jgi:hypothetical protein
VAYSLAAHHPGRCRAVAGLCVPYASAGFALANLLPLVDRDLYPAAEYPDGQWSYYRFYSLAFDQATEDFEADVEATAARRRSRATACCCRRTTSPRWPAR